MAWALKRFASAPTLTILDIDDFNDNIQAFAQEVAWTNEANWTTNSLRAMQDAGSVQFDAGAKVWQVDRGNVDPLGGGGQAIPYSGRWEPVPDTLKEFESTGGPVMIVASWQFHNRPAVSSSQTGFMWAVIVDDSVRYESLVGSGDIANDVRVKPTQNQGVAYGSTHDGTGPAIKADQYGMCTDLLIFLEPGLHTMQLGCRNPAVTTTVNIDQEVTLAELVAVELHA